jgi:hypothetical protein
MGEHAARPSGRKNASAAKTGGQATVTLKHLSAELADNHEVPKKQAEGRARRVGGSNHATSQER